MRGAALMRGHVGVSSSSFLDSFPQRHTKGPCSSYLAKEAIMVGQDRRRPSDIGDAVQDEVC